MHTREYCSSGGVEGGQINFNDWSGLAHEAGNTPKSSCVSGQVC